MTFGDRLKRERERLGIKRGRLAKMANVPRSVIIRAEENPKSSMTVASAVKLARALNVPLDVLAGTYEVEELKG